MDPQKYSCPHYTPEKVPQIWGNPHIAYNHEQTINRKKKSETELGMRGGGCRDSMAGRFPGECA